ncbi:hypothetical protein L4D00_00020 [Photobacterium swingsii]|uniref:SF0329 family protein n=1 Tax=Photobacterium swingsii TaxID=680026 RepID=UPI003D14DB1D
MRWTKRKARVESMFSDVVKGRVELKSSRYRGSHDEVGRGYITFDKKELWNMCTLTFYPIEAERIQIIVERDNVTPYQAQKEALKDLYSEGILSQEMFYHSLDEYCNNSIEKSLYSDNLLIRCLSLLDSRVGKRRLRLLINEQLTPKELEFLKIRYECESIPFKIEETLPKSI